MAISFSTSFSDLGKLLAAFANLNGFSGNQAISTASLWGSSGPVIKPQSVMVTDILTRLEGSGLTSLIPYGGWQDTFETIDTSLQSQKTVLQQLAQQVIITRVNNDVPQQSSQDFTQAMTEWIRQMQVQTESVAQSTMSSATTAGSGNTGTSVTGATVYSSLYDANGLLLEYAYDETLVVQCIQDQFTGADAGSEQFSVTSPAQAENQLSYLWPAGSGVSTTITMVDPEQGNGGGQNLATGSTSLTTVGAFKAFTGSVPTAWTVDVDGTNISDGTSNAYAGGAHCLAITGNTAGTNLNTALYQSFANGDITSGSTQTLTPNTVYQFYCKVKASVVPAAGALSFQLTDGSGTVVNNNAGTANTITTTVSGYGSTAYQTITGTFQTPTNMPENIRLRIRASTKITTGSVVYVDYLALTEPTSNSGYGGLYAGGPFLSAFRGSVDPVNYVSPTIGDRWTVAVVNNGASSSPYPLSFNILFNQLFNMSSLGLILPSSGSPTQASSLIS